MRPIDLDYFKDPPNADVTYGFPDHELVAGTKVISLTAGIIAVQLGHIGGIENNNIGGIDWLRLRGAEGGSVGIDVITGRKRELGESALIASFLLKIGEKVVIGRNEYPELSPYASREHVQIGVPSVHKVTVKDLESYNGTTLRFKRPAHE